eukprot:3905673-Amphidinium_carterae.1
MGSGGKHSAHVAEALEKAFLVKDRDVLGPAVGDFKEIRLLNRKLTWHADPDRIEYIADSRHALLLQSQLGMNERNKSLSSPGVAVEFNEKTAKLLSEEE